MHRRLTTHIPMLPYNILHVYYADISSKFLNENKFSNLLSQEEKIRASKFRFDKHRNQYIITRGALRILSSYYLNITPENVVFKYGKFGKPDFNLKTTLKFNVSHSENIVIFGFINHFDIGVDVEKIKDDFKVLDIAKNFFSTKEIAFLKNLPKENQIEGFYRCWTRKESFIKAKAKGLSFPLDSFTVDLTSDENVKLLETKWDESEKNDWKLYSFTPKKNYIAAISVKGNTKSVEYFNFNTFIHKNNLTFL